MTSTPWLCFVTATLLCLTFGQVRCGCKRLSYNTSSSGKPLLKRSNEQEFKTLLSLDGGALRGAVTAMILIEIEDAIKHYLLDHPKCLPKDLEIASVDDFDINLVDFFDCMTGVSAGSGAAVYLASRGGQGVSRSVLDDPDIIAKYGLIPSGGAEGLRVFYNEYAAEALPIGTIDPNAGPPFDPANPMSPGSFSTLYNLDGLEAAYERFVGNATLADADTSLLVPAVDLGTGLTIYFVNNAFKDPPVTSSARLLPRTGARPVPKKRKALVPDVAFDGGKDYLLKDVAVASSALIGVFPAKHMTEVGNDTVEFQLVDGGLTKENTDLFGALFVSSEAELFDFDKLAIMSVGTGIPLLDMTGLGNAGSTLWGQDLRFMRLMIDGGLRLWPALLDYLYYADPDARPFQYLRINGLESMESVNARSIDPRSVPAFEEFGQRVAAEHREVIEVFVKEFIFG